MPFRRKHLESSQLQCFLANRDAIYVLPISRLCASIRLWRTRARVRFGTRHVRRDLSVFLCFGLFFCFSSLWFYSLLYSYLVFSFFFFFGNAESLRSNSTVTFDFNLLQRGTRVFTAYAIATSALLCVELMFLTVLLAFCNRNCCYRCCCGLYEYYVFLFLRSQRPLDMTYCVRGSLFIVHIELFPTSRYNFSASVYDLRRFVCLLRRGIF